MTNNTLNQKQNHAYLSGSLSAEGGCNKSNTELYGPFFGLRKKPQT